MRKNIAEHSIAIVLILGLWFVSGFITTPDTTPVVPGYYLQMSESINNYNNIPMPFVNRVLSPLLISLFNDNVLGFKIINEIACILFALVLFVFLRKLRFSFIIQLFSIFLWFISFQYQYCHFYIFLVDPLALLFFILGMYAIFNKLDVLFMLSLFLGVLAKETVFLLIPIYMLYNISFHRSIKTKGLILIGFFLLYELWVGLGHFWFQIPFDASAEPAGFKFMFYYLLNCCGLLWMYSIFCTLSCFVSIRKINTKPESMISTGLLIMSAVLILNSMFRVNFTELMLFVFPIILYLSLVFLQKEYKQNKFIGIGEIIITGILHLYWVLLSCRTQYLYDAISRLGLSFIFSFAPLFVVSAGVLMLLNLIVYNNYKNKKVFYYTVVGSIMLLLLWF